MGKVRLLKCEKRRKKGRNSREFGLFPLSQRLERFIRAEESVHGVTWLGKEEEWSSHSILCLEMGSSGNTRGCCLKGENSFFRRSVQTTVSRAVVPPSPHSGSAAVCPHSECVWLPSKREENQPRFKPQ